MTMQVRVCRDGPPVAVAEPPGAGPYQIVQGDRRRALRTEAGEPVVDDDALAGFVAGPPLSIEDSSGDVVAQVNIIRNPRH